MATEYWGQSNTPVIVRNPGRPVQVVTPSGSYEYGSRAYQTQTTPSQRAYAEAQTGSSGRATLITSTNRAGQTSTGVYGTTSSGTAKLGEFAGAPPSNVQNVQVTNRGFDVYSGGRQTQQQNTITPSTTAATPPQPTTPFSTRQITINPYGSAAEQALIFGGVPSFGAINAYNKQMSTYEPASEAPKTKAEANVRMYQNTISDLQEPLRYKVGEIAFQQAKFAAAVEKESHSKATGFEAMKSLGITLGGAGLYAGLEAKRGGYQFISEDIGGFLYNPPAYTAGAVIALPMLGYQAVADRPALLESAKSVLQNPAHTFLQAEALGGVYKGTLGRLPPVFKLFPEITEKGQLAGREPLFFGSSVNPSFASDWRAGYFADTGKSIVGRSSAFKTAVESAGSLNRGEMTLSRSYPFSAGISEAPQFWERTGVVSVSKLGETQTSLTPQPSGRIVTAPSKAFDIGLQKAEIIGRRGSTPISTSFGSYTGWDVYKTDKVFSPFVYKDTVFAEYLNQPFKTGEVTGVSVTRLGEAGLYGHENWLGLNVIEQPYNVRVRSVKDTFDFTSNVKESTQPIINRLKFEMSQQSLHPIKLDGVDLFEVPLRIAPKEVPKSWEKFDFTRPESKGFQTSLKQEPSIALNKVKMSFNKEEKADILQKVFTGKKGQRSFAGLELSPPDSATEQRYFEEFQRNAIRREPPSVSEELRSIKTNAVSPLAEETLITERIAAQRAQTIGSIVQPSTRLVQYQIPQIKTKVYSDIYSMQGQKQNLKQDLNIMQKQGLQLEQKQTVASVLLTGLKSTQDFFTDVIYAPPIPIPPPPRIVNEPLIKEILFPDLLPPRVGKKKLDKRFESFDILIRRHGKFEKKGTTKSLFEAMTLGENIAQNTLARSFKIERTGTGQPITNLMPSPYFRQSKRDSGVLVQKSINSLSSIGEKTEIRMSKRRKYKGFL